MDPRRRPGPELVQPGKGTHRRSPRVLRPKPGLEARRNPARRWPYPDPRRFLTPHPGSRSDINSLDSISKTPAAKNLLGTAGKGTTFALNVFCPRTAPSAPFRASPEPDPFQNFNFLRFSFTHHPSFPPQPPYHPMKAPSITSPKKQIPSSHV